MWSAFIENFESIFPRMWGVCLCAITCVIFGREFYGKNIQGVISIIRKQIYDKIHYNF